MALVQIARGIAHVRVRLLSTDAGATRGRLFEPRSASAAGLTAGCQAPAGTYSLEGIEVNQADMPARQSMFERTRQSALELLEAQLAASSPNSAEHARVSAELEELRGRDEPLGVLLTRPDTGDFQPGDVLKVRILEMDHASRYVKCTRIYPRKVSLRVLQDPEVEIMTSAAALNGAQTVLARANDKAASSS
ncbi:hypothetical protein KFE25_010288 [Diacronema lutheri]|uniref:Uncharacterized protein n=1 Tax=Diacronema lutheri TaxID=2081491 RepID=A0A8J5XEK5_DIALT|nr:hypothetical protein KFE25_010288 [Diacronema lutheri]